MAYISQETKSRLAPRINSIMKRYGLKGSISVHRFTKLVVTVRSGPIDFIGNYNEVTRETYGNNRTLAKDHLSINQYHYKHHFSGPALQCITELLEAANDGNHDNSDISIDYFDVGWYVDLDIGKWDRPYCLIR